MFNPQGISALDPTVALLGKELQANNVPPGQEAQYFQSKGRPLSPQLAFMIQANQRLQQDSQMSQAKPPQGTVADDLSAAIVQKANTAVAQRLPQMNPRMQGVAQLPQQAVGQPKGMAAGGIIAFEDGGNVRHFDGGDLVTSGAQQALQGQQQPSVLSNTISGIQGIYGARRNTTKTELLAKLANKDPVIMQELVNNPARFSNVGITQTDISNIFGAVPESPFAMTEDERQRQLALRGSGIKPPEVPPAPAAGAQGASSQGGFGNPGFNSAIDKIGAGGTPAQDDDYIKDLRERAKVTPEEWMKKQQGIYDTSGLSAAEKAKEDAIERRRTATLELGKKDSSDKKHDMLMQLAAASFGSVGHNRNLAEGLGKIGSGFAQGAIGVEKEYKGKQKEREALLNTLEDSKNAMQEAKALRAAGDMKGAQTRAEEAQHLMHEAQDKNREIGVKEVANQLHGAGLKDEHAYRMAQIQLGYAGLESKEELAAVKALMGGQAKQMTTKEIGDKILELKSSPDMERFTASWVAQKGKNSINSQDYIAAANKKALELFNQYYGENARGGGSSSPYPADVTAALAKHQ